MPENTKDNLKMWALLLTMLAALLSIIFLGVLSPAGILSALVLLILVNRPK